MGLPSHKHLARLLFAICVLLLFIRDPPPTHADENLLNNPRFEEIENGVPRDWDFYPSTAVFEATESTAKSGKYSASLRKEKKSGYTYLFQSIEATSSAKYRFSGWAFNPGVESVSSVKLRLDWRNIGGDKTGSVSEIKVSGLGWKFLSFEAESPQDAVTVRVEGFTSLSATNPYNPVLFDDFEFLFLGSGGGNGENLDGSALDFTIPETVTAGESFEINVSLQNFDPQTEYRIKFLAAPIGGKFYEGRTLAADGSKYLAWNAAWDKIPKFTTDIEGNAVFNLQVIINNDVPAGEYETKIRGRHSGTEKNLDSEVQNLKVEAAVSQDTDDDEVFEGTLIEIKKLKLGTVIKSRGFVTVPLNIFGEDIFYIRDDSAGIKIRLSNGDIPNLNLGNEVELGSTIEKSHQEFYIKTEGGSEITVLRPGLDAPDPLTSSTGEINESWEGQLVNLTGKIVETSGSTFWIDDGSGRIKIYIKDSTGIEIPTKRVGYSATIVGIVSQWDFLKNSEPNYRVMPRYQDDLEITPPDRESDSTGDILGTVGLPVTGPAQSTASLGLALICLGLASKLLIKTPTLTSYYELIELTKVAAGR